MKSDSSPLLTRLWVLTPPKCHNLWSCCSIPALSLSASNRPSLTFALKGTLNYLWHSCMLPWLPWRSASRTESITLGTSSLHLPFTLHLSCKPMKPFAFHSQFFTLLSISWPWWLDSFTDLCGHNKFSISLWAWNTLGFIKCSLGLLHEGFLTFLGVPCGFEQTI